MPRQNVLIEGVFGAEIGGSNLPKNGTPNSDTDTPDGIHVPAADPPTKTCCWQPSFPRGKRQFLKPAH